MNMRAPSTDLIGIGFYTVGDAARLLRTPARTVRGWLAGYECRRDGERRHVAPRGSRIFSIPKTAWS